MRLLLFKCSSRASVRKAENKGQNCWALVLENKILWNDTWTWKFLSEKPKQFWWFQMFLYLLGLQVRLQLSCFIYRDWILKNNWMDEDLQVLSCVMFEIVLKSDHISSDFFILCMGMYMSTWMCMCISIFACVCVCICMLS